MYYSLMIEMTGGTVYHCADEDVNELFIAADRFKRIVKTIQIFKGNKIYMTVRVK